MYRRLLGYLRPHSWRMVGSIACNIIAAGLDVFSYTLLVPFLNALFKAKQLIPPTNAAWIASLQNRLVGAFLDPADPFRSVQVRHVSTPLRACAHQDRGPRTRDCVRSDHGDNSCVGSVHFRVYHLCVPRIGITACLRRK